MLKQDIPENVDAYIARFPENVQTSLRQMREIIKDAAPEAEEAISYGMPAYRQNGVLVYFGGAKKHIGFYPTGAGVAAFQQELSRYKGAKGSVQLPLDEPPPRELIAKIVKFRIAENLEKALAGKKR
jgi:uncharacterized protein YdhG (YjbR/CyaY superfamily)